MRFETIKASMYLVWKLKFAGITIQQDGGDIILVELPSGETASIHLIESLIEVYEIKSILNDNDRKGYYTLFVLWCDLLLPPEGHLVETYDWERALLALYDNRIYAFEIVGNEVYIFAVHFDVEGAYRHIRYGNTLNMADIGGAIVSGSPYLDGVWRVVRFSIGTSHTDHQPGSRYSAGVPSSMQGYYDLLELAADADADTVKLAYRRLARLYHPDLNKTDDATAKMQAINEAYEQIMKQLEDL